MTRITDLIGYDVEVSAPDGPAVYGYITARWAESRQADFERALNKIKADAWDEGHNHCFHVENPNNPIKGNPYRSNPLVEKVRARGDEYIREQLRARKEQN